MKPKFKAGDRVFYLAINRTGIIKTVINAGDRLDIGVQGYRYEVYFRSIETTYSVLENRLLSKEIHGSFRAGEKGYLPLGDAFKDAP